MARPDRTVRVGILAGVIAAHVLGVLLLMRRPEPLPEAPELAMTWLRLEPPLEVRPEPPRTAVALQSPSLEIPGAASISPETAPITLPSSNPGGPEVDWYREASRAAREQYGSRLPTPRVLDDKPQALELPEPERGHRKGDEEKLDHGEWKVWLSPRCWTILTNEARLPPGQLRPYSIRCLQKAPAIDAAVLERRKPHYILEPPLTLPRKGKGGSQTRAGPAMGGTPNP